MHDRKFSLLTIFAFVLCLGMVATRPARGAVLSDDDDDHKKGATLTVDDDRVQCPSAAFISIQAAVNAANPGDKINVCPGTYNEQVTINKSLTIQGVAVGGNNQAIVKPTNMVVNSFSLASGNPIAAIILVDGASRVDLTNLTIDGVNNNIGGCAPNLIGIYYRNSSGKADSVAVRNVRLVPTLAGCQSGLGIFAQSGNGGSSKVQVLNSSVHDFQKNGITGNEPGTEINVKGNSVSGDGPSPIIAQNGIQIGFGAKGTVDGNSVNNVIYTPCISVNVCAASSTGILVFDPASPVRISNNNVANTQTGIYLQANKAEAGNNTVFQTRIFDGIAIVGDRNTVNGNSISNSDESGVFVQGNKNEVNGNTINETPIGILEFPPSSGNKFGGNHFFNAGVNTDPPASAGAGRPYSAVQP